MRLLHVWFQKEPVLLTNDKNSVGRCASAALSEKVSPITHQKVSEAVSRRRLAEHGPDVGLAFEIRPDFTTKALVQTAAGAIFVRPCTQATTMPMNTDPNKVENVGGWT